MVAPGLCAEGWYHPEDARLPSLTCDGAFGVNETMSGGSITVLLADDNLIVREGVRALLGIESDFEVVAVAADYDELIARAEEHVPHVLVTDIRMPPNFQSEGIDAAKEVRKRN